MVSPSHTGTHRLVLCARMSITLFDSDNLQQSSRQTVDFLVHIHVRNSFESGTGVCSVCSLSGKHSPHTGDGFLFPQRRVSLQEAKKVIAVEEAVIEEDGDDDWVDTNQRSYRSLGSSYKDGMPSNKEEGEGEKAMPPTIGLDAHHCSQDKQAATVGAKDEETKN